MMDKASALKHFNNFLCTLKEEGNVDVADAILEQIGASASVEVPRVEKPKVIRPELKATKWEARPDGNKERQVPFSEKYWEPKHMPDHLVYEFTGYDVAVPVAEYIPPKEEFERFSLGIALGLKTLLVGPTGAGKDRMPEHYCATTGRPLLRIDHTQELDRSYVFGQTHLNDGENGTTTDFIPGILPQSFQAPYIVTLSELSRATAYANIIYQRLLDRRELAMPELKDAGLDVLTPDPQWVICASDNTKGNGDDLDKYSASNVQDAAFINRWDMLIEVDYLTDSEESRLIKGLAPNMDARDRRALCKFSALLHAGFKSGEVSTAFSPRNLQAIALLTEAGVDLNKAVHMNYITRVPESELSDIQESYRSAFGS